MESVGPLGRNVNRSVRQFDDLGRALGKLGAAADLALGTTLLPVLTAVDLPEGVTALDLADEEIWRVVGLLTHGDSVPTLVAFAFRRFVLDELPELARTLGLQLEPL